MNEKKTELIELILGTVFQDDKSEWIAEISPQEVEFFRPLNFSLMRRYRITWDNDLNFRIEKSKEKRWVLQIYQSSRWFKLNDKLRIRHNEVQKHLMCHQFN